MSQIVRRTHMYLGLFFFPWMAMYALSTMAMNHRALFTAPGEAPPALQLERELEYPGFVPEGAELRTISRQILSSLGLDGAHTATRRKDGAVVINRQDLTKPRRVTYVPETRRITIEVLPHRTSAFLERFHRRRGYSTGYALDTVWAVSVDLVIAAMVFWVLSGLWMWWEMRVTRGFGTIALLGGAGLFVLYLTVL